MRFQFLLFVALARVAIASPISSIGNVDNGGVAAQYYTRESLASYLHRRQTGLIQSIGKLIQTLEDDFGVTAVSEALDAISGGTISDLEVALGLTQAEQGLGLGSDDPLPDGLIQNIGNLIKFFEDTVGITALEAVLDEALGGNLTAVLDALGLTELEEALGLA